MSEATISTWQLLQELGFVADPTVYSDVTPGLTFDFGNFKLSAGCVTNLKYVEVVLFTGVMKSPRSIAEVSFEMPRFIDAAELCPAWIVWHLDKCADEKQFQPATIIPWVEAGRMDVHLLPWVAELERLKREQEEYQARPHCTARRPWVKLALKTPGEHLAQADDAELVEVGFDGRILSFKILGEFFALAAEGNAWSTPFQTSAGMLRDLPTRLRGRYIEVSVWRERLLVDGYKCGPNIDLFPTARETEPDLDMGLDD